MDTRVYHYSSADLLRLHVVLDRNHYLKSFLKSCSLSTLIRAPASQSLPAYDGWVAPVSRHNYLAMGLE